MNPALRGWLAVLYEPLPPRAPDDPTRLLRTLWRILWEVRP